MVWYMILHWLLLQLFVLLHVTVLICVSKLLQTFNSLETTPFAAYNESTEKRFLVKNVSKEDERDPEEVYTTQDIQESQPYQDRSLFVI